MAGEELRSLGEGRVEALRGFSKHRLSEVSEKQIKLTDRLSPNAASLAAEGCDALYNLGSLWLGCVFYRRYLRYILFKFTSMKTKFFSRENACIGLYDM